MTTAPLDPLTPRSWTVGDLVVHLVPETTFSPQTAAWLLPEATPALVADVDWLGDPWTDADHRPRLASQSYALEVDGQRILIDAGIGNGKTHDNDAFHNLDTDFLDRLAQIGFTPQNVDLLLLTHIHADHVGWFTRHDGEQWVPTFPHARHLTSRTEWDYWATTDVEPSRRRMLDDSVLPVDQPGLVNLVDLTAGGVQVAPGVTLIPTPGHTPGHASVRITSRGQTALVTGDAVHHPVQAAFPDISSCVDVDSATAARTRRALLTEALDTDQLLLGTHFPAPGAARVRAADGSYRLSAQEGSAKNPNLSE